jgi:diaminopimelate decarboxylase
VINPFVYSSGSLTCDGHPLSSIAAEFGTPVYVYSAQGILDRFHAYNQALGGPHRICYAVKANSNLAVLRLLAQAGSGFDIVSGGELFRVLRAGGEPAKVVFSGVGKTRAEVDYALASRIHSFNCESEGELHLIQEAAAAAGVRARVAIRVNPDVDASTHPYISTGLKDHKFGVDIDEAAALYERAMLLGNLDAEGVSCHIGSQLLDPAPLFEAIEKVLALADRLRRAGVPIRHVDLGGGLGVAYEPDQESPAIPSYVSAVLARIQQSGLIATLEPGRSIVAESGALISRVLFRKRQGEKEFVIIDAAMNDLIRPALYRAHHEIVPLMPRGGSRLRADVVGPVCETGDFLAKDRELEAVEPGDLVAILTAGAYGFVQASNYNSRPRAAEVLVTGDGPKLVRRRESPGDLIRGEELD